MRTKMEICFRKGKENDLSEIMDLVQSAILHMERLGIMQWDTLYPDVNDFSADLAAEQLYVGLMDNRIAVIYTLNQLYDEAYQQGKWKLPEEPFLVVHRLCVHPKFQNLGIAEKTMAHIEAQAAQFKINAIRLDVFSQNPFALKLYEKCGYAKTGTVNWRKGMFYLMEKYLFHPHVDPLTVIDGSVQ